MDAGIQKYTAASMEEIEKKLSHIPVLLSVLTWLQTEHKECEGNYKEKRYYLCI